MSSSFGAAGLVTRGLRHYLREHLLVAAATAVAVAVLVGALVVGDSVRGSLRSAFTERLGATDYTVLPIHAFSADPDSGLAARLASREEYRERFETAVPIYRLSGSVFAPDGAPVAVTVFGVDARFFTFHGLEGAIEPGTARLSSGLRRLGIGPGDALLLRVGGHQSVAAASLFGEKEDAGITLRRQVAAWPDPAPGVGSGDFALFPGQGAVRAVFLPLDDLRRVLDPPGDGRRAAAAPPRANALLIRTGPRGGGDAEEDAGVLSAALGEVSSLDDRGLSLAVGRSGGWILESRSLVLDDGIVEGALAAAEALGAGAAPVLTYLATSIRTGNRETPYSLVSGIPAPLLPGGDAAEGEEDRFFPGPWLADDLGLNPGDPVELSFLIWEEQGRFRSESASFAAGAPVAGDGLFADGTLAPEFPGVSDSTRMGDWDPPFPVDLSRIRERDEEYWEEHRTLPKAFVPLATARRLWPMRQGSATSVRFHSGVAWPENELPAALLAALPPEDFGLEPLPVRQRGLEASRGATDFGLYFLYFSYFLLVSAFVLLALLYRLGVERRLREIGLLLACGWSPRRVARNLLVEAGVVALAGAAAGAAVGLAYASGMVGLLSGVWEGAVAGTLSGDAAGGGSGAALGVSVRWSSVLSGVFSGLVMAMVAASWTLRKLVRCSPRGLLAGNPTGDVASWAPLAPIRAPGAAARRFAVVTGGGGAVLLFLGATETIPEAGGFFGAGAALLTAALLFAWSRLRRAADPARRGAPMAGREGLRGLAFRATTFRPGRSLAAMALVAFAAFTLVAVEAFRKRADPGTLPAGAGGFVSLSETVFGSPWDPRDPEGREALNLPPDLSGFRLQPLRLAGDEDASCLNLYRPSRPRVIGIPSGLAEENRFPFGAHLGDSSEEIENPWRLLWRPREPGEAIPVIGDQNSMTYVLKWPVGEERSFPIGRGGAEVRLRLVATLWDSLFQGELLMAEDDLLQSLPTPDGYRLFLAEAEELPGDPEALAAIEGEAVALVDEALSDYGVASTPTRVRLDEFHRVENTYLSTFQALGGLGLLLGTFGLGAVLLRNADERRQEWALLAAAGYRRRDFTRLGFWENALLLIAGLAAGSAAALLAILPVLGERDAGGSLGLLALMLAGVLGFGLAAGALAARVAANRPILESLRAG